MANDYNLKVSSLKHGSFEPDIRVNLPSLRDSHLRERRESWLKLVVLTSGSVTDGRTAVGARRSCCVLCRLYEELSSSSRVEKAHARARARSQANQNG